jgi:hypothetical protein
MESRRKHVFATLGALATWCAYIAFALVTSWQHFGLTPTWPANESKYTIARIGVMTGWLLVAALLLFLRHRAHPVNWRSFSYAFAGTAITYLLFSSYLVVSGANHLAIAGSLVFYGLVSGFFFLTIDKPSVAAVMGAGLLALQLLIDLLLAMASGVLRIH